MITDDVLIPFHSLEIGSVLPQYFLGIFDNGKDHPGTWDSNIIPAVLTHTFLIVVNVFNSVCFRVQISYGFDAFIHLI